jgi:hypothetical protein
MKKPAILVAAAALLAAVTFAPTVASAGHGWHGGHVHWHGGHVHWRGGHWHGGRHWHGYWGPRWGWGGWGWGPRVYVGPRYGGCWAPGYGWVPCGGWWW